jgi:hypothetical protein
MAGPLKRADVMESAPSLVMVPVSVVVQPTELPDLVSVVAPFNVIGPL